MSGDFNDFVKIALEVAIYRANFNTASFFYVRLEHELSPA
jgi:hypothetical protein